MTLEGPVSFVEGATTPPLLELTIGAALDRAAATWADRLALVSCSQDFRWTWRELKRRVDALAAGLLELGLEPGDRIGVWSPNRAEWALTQLAAAKVGLILVTINPAYRAFELEYTLNKAGVRALITAERFKSSDYIAMVEELAPEIISAKPGDLSAARAPSLQIVVTLGEARPGWLAFAEVEAHGPAAGERVAAVGAQLSSHDPINIQFTSGTTGAPKGATLTHRNILNNGYFVGGAIGLGPDDRICIPVPLYHCFGMVMGNLAALTHGAAMVYPSEGFDPRAVVAALTAERCTALYGVPTMFLAVLEQADLKPAQLSGLRKGIMAGAPCPAELMQQVIDTLGVSDITIAYGMTETSPVSFQTAGDDPVSRRIATIGRVQPHLQMKIIDAEGKVTPRGVPGEICTRGYSVMQGYWGDPEQTAQAIDADGWMHTGDVGMIDDEGYGQVVRRIKDMVIRGGENIYPSEVEAFFRTHPKIADVHVVGVPDVRYGEELCAWIRLQPGQVAEEAELRAYAKSRITHFKVPRYIRLVEEFPMTVTGKVQKFVMRERMIDELGLDVPKRAS